jgi:hypothetical protein
MDSRVASPIIMGNESIYRTDEIQWHLSFHHAFFQDQVNVPVFYIGATNEGGYDMFNINLLQERLKQPMTIEMIYVADTAMGFPGYVTSLPIKLTGKPVEPRVASEAGWMGPPEEEE